MRGSGNHTVNPMIIGRWSDFRVAIGLQREPTVMCVEAIERSGEELSPLRGILVGSSAGRCLAIRCLDESGRIVSNKVAHDECVFIVRAQEQI